MRIRPLNTCSILLLTLACLGQSRIVAAETATTADLRNNMKCVDLSDLKGELPLEIASSKQILWQTEPWERSTWPADKGHESVGYPTMVRNDRGANPDGRYYLYYAHHDPNSGIGCAVAESVEGPYVKLAQADKARGDSRVLVCPGKPGQPFHYSSPCVVWNEQGQLWFMYFHFYENQWQTGGGHQRTALATCPDLTKNVWTPWVDQQGKLVPVLPVTAERWMNSQSSYHAIQRLADGRWLAFLRGTGGESTDAGKWIQDPCKLGFATSTDGRHWDYFPENPVIHQDDGGGGRKGVYRPHFVGDLGNGKYLLCWSESNPYDGGANIVYGYTSDFRTVTRDKRGYAHWPMGDGLISPWREGGQLYLFAGKYLHVMNLPVSPSLRSERATRGHSAFDASL
ncbi:MAG: hypothetical protein GXX96_29230 [Planctomycetaceae bacterium]|nr:hypothetical protein [Planctomycetaceae bacterium]